MRVVRPLSRQVTARPGRTTRIGRAAAALLAAGLVVGAAAPAWPQGRDLQALIDRIERLQNEMTTIQRDLYGGGKPPASPSAAAPGEAPAAMPDQRAAARLEVRLTQLETELRTLTGRIEQVDHTLRQLTGRVEKLVSDVDFRLRALEQGRPSKADSGGSGPGAPRSSASVSLGTAAGGEAAAPPGAPPPQSLGTITQGDLSRLRGGRQTATATPARSSDGTPQEQYEHAISLLQRQDVAGAETAFRAFLDANSDHPLASNAQYWLGETYYVRHDFQQAAFIFAEGFQRYPQSNKAPDSLLKLGMSLARLGKKTEACTAFTRLSESFPDASPTLKRRVSAQRRQVDCH